MTGPVDVVSVTLDRVYPNVRAALSAEVFNYAYQHAFSHIASMVDDPTRMELQRAIMEELTRGV